ncbi:MAG TPA: cysteine hydrolase family protein [Bryobacteraceae bacterium]
MKTVFVDVDTQLDFLFPAGALYVPGAEKLVASLKQLTEFAARNRIPVVSTADAHTEDDAEFQSWKPHCVAGTAGQQKTAATLVNGRVTLPTTPRALDAIPREAPQIIVEKQQLDCFTNRHLRPLLEMLAAERYVVYGVVTELCVRCAAFGLLETGARVELVTDAIETLNPQTGKDTINRFREQGGVITTVAEVTS